MHFFLRVEEGGGDGIFQERFAVFFEGGNFGGFEGLALVLFFLEHLALAHQGLVLAACAGVGEKGINPVAQARRLDLFDDGLAEFLGFLFNFGRHKKMVRTINHIPPAKAIANAACRMG